MLDPATRHVYLDALKPPEGFSLDRAVGSTYSLDLETLLAVPLGFAMLDWENERGALSRDPVALLHALRRCADRVTIFCQNGHIAAPARHHPLFAHLEPMVIEAEAPEMRGSLHAKMWLLRFTSGDGAVRYRFLCLSRNLTPDRSWDTILALDGTLSGRERAFVKNHPLGDFVAALPSLALHKLPTSRRRDVALLAEEARRVKFDPPLPFDDFAFWPLGFPGARGFPLEGRADRRLIISPFLSEGFLQRLASEGTNLLVSRPESLTALDPKVLTHFADVYVLSDATVEEDGDEKKGEDSSASPFDDFRGLHAKLFIADQGWNASVWTGSANATDAAFGRNIEFLVQLKGKKSKVGIDTFLDGAGCGGFRAMLSPFSIGNQDKPDTEGEANEKRAEAARELLARAGLRLRVEHSEGDTFDLLLLAQKRGPFDLNGVDGRCWPAAVNPSLAKNLATLVTERELRFHGLTVHGLTSFFVFEVTAGTGTKAATIRFALNLPMEGAPEDRLEHVLKAVLGDRERLLRYMLFLLARDEDVAALGPRLLPEGDRTGNGTSTNGLVLPLFEELVRALARSPEKLKTVARLVDDLGRTEQGAALLPKGFDLVWEAIWTARESPK